MFEVKIQAEIGIIEKSLRTFIENYKPKKAIVVSLKGAKGKTKINSCNIIYTDVLNLEKQL